MTTAVALPEPALDLETPRPTTRQRCQAVRTPNFPSLAAARSDHFW